MTVAYFCVFIVIFIPLVLVGYAKFSTKGYDNRAPRDLVEKLQGKAKRAHYAQLNAYEVFPPFVAGVLIASYTGTSQTQIDILAVLFVIARIFYSLAYVADRSTLRSVFWVGGLACIIGLFVVAF